MGFLGATPVVIRPSTTDLKDMLVTLGLLTDSGATPLNLDGGNLTASTVAATNLAATNLTASLDAADAVNIAVGTTTGTKIGTAVTQKIGFWNVTPVVQPAGANQGVAANGTTTTATTTNLDTGLTNLRTLVHEIRTALVNTGIIKGAA